MLDKIGAAIGQANKLIREQRIGSAETEKSGCGWGRPGSLAIGTGSKYFACALRSVGYFNGAFHIQAGLGGAGANAHILRSS